MADKQEEHLRPDIKNTFKQSEATIVILDTHTIYQTQDIHMEP
jgi:hypothetical protein